MAEEIKDAKEIRLADLTNVDIEHYQNLLECLRHNREKVPLEILKTKYGKAFYQLKVEIRDLTKKIIYDVVCSDLFIERSQSEEIFKNINRSISDSGILPEINHAVFLKQDMDQILGLMMKLREVVHAAADKMEE